MGKNYRILIIDDSKETVKGLEAFFSEKYEVSTAYNGLDGIKEFDNSDGCVDPCPNGLSDAGHKWDRGNFCDQREIPRTAHHCNDRLGRAPECTGKRYKSGYGFE